MNAPLVLEIKANSLDDGPGIRSVVFFKGCPLSCIWCHNPESKRIPAEISYDKNECIGCGTCIKTCKTGAVSPSNPDLWTGISVSCALNVSISAPPRR